MIETKKTELRHISSNPKELINMFIASRVLKTWTEDFLDQDTGETVAIERNEVLYDRGTLIDQDILAKLQFYIQTGDIKEIEVSNQRRMAYQLENNYLHTYMAVVDMGDKKHRFIFYATRIETAIPLLKDYVELNYTSGFFITSIKEFDTTLILIDNLKKLIPGEEENELAIDDEETDDSKKKFYQIDFNVEVDGISVSQSTAVVQTYNVDRAMMLINNHLIKREKERLEDAKSKGHEYQVQDYTTSIEAAKPIPIGVFIPKEFSVAYMD